MAERTGGIVRGALGALRGMRRAQRSAVLGSERQARSRRADASRALGEALPGVLARIPGSAG